MTEPGLHYLVILYDSILIFLIGLIILFLLKTINNVYIKLFVIGVSIIIPLPALSNFSSNYFIQISGSIFSIFGILGHLIIISKIWFWIKKNEQQTH